MDESYGYCGKSRTCSWTNFGLIKCFTELRHTYRNWDQAACIIYLKNFCIISFDVWRLNEVVKSWDEVTNSRGLAVVVYYIYQGKAINNIILIVGTLSWHPLWTLKPTGLMLYSKALILSTCGIVKIGFKLYSDNF